MVLFKYISDTLWHLKRFFFLNYEKIRYALLPTKQQHHFFIVSCSYNPDKAAIKCLQSVYNQKYPKNLITHLFIDDVSSDNSEALITDWLKLHPDNSVNYIRNKEHKGGTYNTIWGFRRAPSESIVLELNGDDWLPDDRVLPFLNKVYLNTNVWMTYNTFKHHNGRIPKTLKPVPKKVLRNNSYRDYFRWISSHLHSFRQQLFTHIRKESFIDPDTGKFWESADDQAIYLCMLELAGRHSCHLYRVTYMYNFRDISEENKDKQGGLNRVRRIRSLPKYEPLKQLYNKN